jgi:catechol 2,3-dioxygenase-like lactoylglutathione lyase family enzyme
MHILGLDHVNISGPHDLIERCRDFYAGVLGLTEGHRPPFSSKGFWLYAGGRPVVHLTESPTASGTSGALDHFAFKCEGIDGMVKRLQSHAVPFRRTTVPATNQVQLFVEDPAGAKIELNFDAG